MRLLSNFLLAVSVLSFAFTAGAAIQPNEDFNQVLGKFVVNGRPDYRALKADSGAKLSGYLEKLASFDLSGLKSENERKAFWINAYNAFAMKIVLDNYPARKDLFSVSGFFDLQRTKIGGRNLSLVEISSNELLLGHENKDPRINFAISQGTVSSPRLRAKAFMADTIDRDLDDCAREFVVNRSNVSIKIETLNKGSVDKETLDFISKGNFASLNIVEPHRDANGKVVDEGQYPKFKLVVSEIFKWFEKDFGGNGKSVAAFVSSYLPKEDAAFVTKNLDKFVIDYSSYSWDFAGF
jgi:hypothetical protein